MQILIKEYREGSKEESMKHIINAAYEATLKKYHGFIVKKVFSVRTVGITKNFISSYFLAFKHEYQIIAPLMYPSQVQIIKKLIIFSSK